MSKEYFYQSDYEEAFVNLLQQNGWEYSFGDSVVNKEQCKTMKCK